jgi:hypothetical protein
MSWTPVAAINATVSDNTTVSVGAGLPLYQTTRGQIREQHNLDRHCRAYNRLIPQKPLVSAAGNVSEPRLTSQFASVREFMCA